MDEVYLEEPVKVRRGGVLRIDDGAGLLVCVWTGEVWVTEQDSAEDHVLVAGQSLRLSRGGTALVHAFRCARLSLSSAGEALSASRITLRERGSPAPALVYRREGALGAALRRLAGGRRAAAPRTVTP